MRKSGPGLDSFSFNQFHGCALRMEECAMQLKRTLQYTHFLRVSELTMKCTRSRALLSQFSSIRTKKVCSYMLGLETSLRVRLMKTLGASPILKNCNSSWNLQQNDLT